MTTPAAGGASPRRSSQAILIVDDDAYVPDTIRAALRGLRAELLTARSAAEALALAGDRRLDLAILDVGLPDDDGYRLAASLRQQPGREGLRIIMLTGQWPDGDAARAAGADAIMAKPFRINELLRRVREQLDAVTDASLPAPDPR